MILLQHTEKASYYRMGVNILVVVITTDYLDEYVLLEIWNNRDRLANQHHLTDLISTQTTTFKMSRKAKKMSLNKEAIGNFYSIALIHNNPVMAFLINVFLSVAKFSIPIKTFANIESSVAWIKALQRKKASNYLHAHAV